MTDHKIAVFAPEDFPHDEATLKQLETCAVAGQAPRAVICADGHLGYSAPIGSAIGYENYLSPSGVGYDIGCGNKAVATSLLYGDVREDLPRIMDEIMRRISFGVGQSNRERVDHPVIDEIKATDFRPVKALAQQAAAQLGTVGAGNHYVDLFREDKTDRVWIGVHFGSRGFGHKIASGFLAIADGLNFGDRPIQGEMMAPPTLIDIDSPTGYLYQENMELAGRYAYAGRDIVCDKVLDILGAEEMESVHNHHNFAWLEEHDGIKMWVVRKGSTPLFPGQLGFVGSTMGEDSVILEGVESERGVSALYSAPHGAGRAMSRKQAAGSTRKRSQCQACGYVQQPHTPMFKECPECGSEDVKRNRIQEKTGEIDWEAAKADLAHKNIELRGGAADEAPGAYKRLPSVLAAHGDAVRIRNVLKPIGVAMAPSDTHDPFKD